MLYVLDLCNTEHHVLSFVTSYTMTMTTIIRLASKRFDSMVGCLADSIRMGWEGKRFNSWVGCHEDQTRRIGRQEIRFVGREHNIVQYLPL